MKGKARLCIPLCAHSGPGQSTIPRVCSASDMGASCTPVLLYSYNFHKPLLLLCWTLIIHPEPRRKIPKFISLPVYQLKYFGVFKSIGNTQTFENPQHESITATPWFCGITWQKNTQPAIFNNSPILCCSKYPKLIPSLNSHFSCVFFCVLKSVWSLLA